MNVVLVLQVTFHAYYLFVLVSHSKYGPSIKDVLFKEDFSFTNMLGSKMASKLTFDAVPSGATLDPKIFLDLRCMSILNFKGCFRLAINLLVLAMSFG